MIAYVDSPFQLLQYNELEKKGYVASKVFVRLNGSNINDEQLKCLASELKVKNVEIIKVRSFWEVLLSYTRLLLLSVFTKRIILGDPNSFLFKLLNKFNYKSKFLLLDDGVATLSSTNSDINLNYKRFTIFPNYAKNSIHNNFSYLSKIVNKESELVRKHIIVGAKFVNAGICSKEVYLKAILTIIDNLGNEECLYIPHRGETEEDLDFLKKNIPLEIVRLNLPVEMIFLEKGIYPLSISHTLSTAVFSMKYIYDAPIHTYKIPSESLIERKESIEKLYNILEQESFPFL